MSPTNGTENEYEALLDGEQSLLDAATVEPEVPTKAEVETKPKPVKKKKTKATKAVAAQMDAMEQTSFVIENLDEAEAKSMLQDKISQADYTYFEIGGLLQKINVEGWYDSFGYENFKTFVVEETNLEYRKALYWVQIYDVLTKLGVKWEQVKDIQWTKLRELASRVFHPEMEDDEVAAWLQKAREMTVVALVDHIKHWKAQEAGDAPVSELPSEPVSTMTFKVHDDQKEIIDAAVDSAMELVGTDTKAVGLDHICQNFLSGGSMDAVAAPPPSFGDLCKAADDEDISNMIMLVGLEKIMQVAGVTPVFKTFEVVWPDFDIEVTVDELPEDWTDD